MALALQLLLALLGTTPGLGAPGGGCGMPPSAWCQDWVTALRCGALGRCPHLTQRHPDMDICAVCQRLFDFLRQASNQSAMGDGGQVPLRGPWAQVSLGVMVGASKCHNRKVPLGVPLWLMKWWQPLRKPWQVCATLKLCHREPGAAPVVPILEAPSTHLQGSGGAGLSPEALPLPLPLCWLCRRLVARAE
ncbi:PSPB protein, partial [Hirundo rustica]|nr:PSPB protein [Hirundo rustica]